MFPEERPPPAFASPLRSSVVRPCDTRGKGSTFFRMKRSAREAKHLRAPSATTASSPDAKRVERDSTQSGRQGWFGSTLVHNLLLTKRVQICKHPTIFARKVLSMSGCNLQWKYVHVSLYHRSIITYLDTTDIAECRVSLWIFFPLSLMKDRTHDSPPASKTEPASRVHTSSSTLMHCSARSRLVLDDRSATTSLLHMALTAPSTATILRLWFTRVTFLMR